MGGENSYRRKRRVKRRDRSRIKLSIASFYTKISEHKVLFNSLIKITDKCMYRQSHVYRYDGDCVRSHRAGRVDGKEAPHVDREEGGVLRYSKEFCAHF